MPADPEPVAADSRPPSAADRDEQCLFTEALHEAGGAPPLSDAAIRTLSAVLGEFAVAGRDGDDEPAAAEHGDDRVLRPLREMVSERRRSRFTRALDLAAGLRTARAEASHPVIAGVVAEQCAITSVLTADSVRALTDLAAASAANARVGVLHRRSLLLSSMVHSLRGNLREGGQFLQRAQRTGGSPVPPGPSEGWATLAGALVRIESGSPGDGTRTAPLPAVETIGELWPLVMLAQGREALIAHSPLRVVESAEFALQCHDVHGVLALDAATWLLVHGHLGLGDVTGAEEALAWHGQAEGRLSRLAEARLLLEKDQPARTREIADRLIALRGGSVAMRGEALLLRIWADCLLGGHSDPMRNGVAARLATHSGLLRPFAHMPQWLIDEIADSLEGELSVRFRAATRGLATASTERPAEPLSPREQIVLDALFEHESIADVAAALYVSPSTVKSQLSAVYRKLGVHSRSAAIAAAVRAGMRPPARRREPG